MKLTDFMNKSESNFFSIEISPPFKFKSINTIFSAVERLLPYKPAFVNITYHPLKITRISVDNISGEFIQKKHVHPLGLCAAIKYKYNVDVVPHFVCAGLNKVQVENDLSDFSFLGFKNILALRGDPVAANAEFHPVDGGYQNASQLVTQINSMRNSVFVNNIDKHAKIDFCVGVAGYPEKHFEAVNLENDITNLKKKVDAGADYIITQICYDLVNFERWLEAIRKAGINIPVIPGIKPLTSLSQLLTLKNVYNIHIPKRLEEMIVRADIDNQAYQVGIEHGIELSESFIKLGFKGLHYFLMGNGKDIEEVVKAVYGFKNQDLVK